MDSTTELPLALRQLNTDRYQQLLAASQSDPIAFWRQIGQRLQWIEPFTHVKDVSFLANDFRIRWYGDGVLNVSVNCLDRHLPQHGDKVAIRFEADEPGQIETLTYAQLHQQVCQLANGLRTLGIGKGDRVSIYLPMIPVAAIAMLACARIGAIHSVVFAGFSAESLIGRIEDCGSKLVITADAGKRGGKLVPLKVNVDLALLDPRCACVEQVLVYRHVDDNDLLKDLPQHPRDIDYQTLCAAQPGVAKAEPMSAEDPLFILYTSGSTGKPKGVLHTSGGYLAYASYTHEMIFDLQANDVYWCTADVGWITGHSYVVYGPLSNAATTLMFEGVPSYPSPARFWQIIDRHQVSIFYTAPTAIRALMREGDQHVKASARRSLRLLGTVGEPINPEAWRWYFEVCGDQRCPIVDTFWQTETGGVMISPVPGVHTPKPGAAMQALPGIQAHLLDAQGALVRGDDVQGNLVFADSWPGQMRTVYRDHQRFFDTYFSTYPGYYFTGDGAKRDADGHYWITGRVDDVINVAGHRLGTAEIESALVEHPAVAESAVVGFPHDIKGQGIYAFVTLKLGFANSEAMQTELVQTVRRLISPIATPDVIQLVTGLPKTRSGKIMRRILRKIASGETEQLGDVSTLADPGVVQTIVDQARMMPRPK